jgi:hypothetical protein
VGLLRLANNAPNFLGDKTVKVKGVPDFRNSKKQDLKHFMLRTNGKGGGKWIGNG